MNVAFIPVRGGSKSIPLKNIKNMCGKPLVYWTVAAACKCKEIDKVYVATDSEKIKHVLQEIKENEKDSVFQKLEVIGRSAESASDTASTEFAMLEFAGNYEFDHIVLIQATSPLLDAEDLNRGFSLYRQEDCDSVLSVVRQKRFNWEVDEDGNAKAINYDYFYRPRRQEFDGYCVENGAFYITSKERLMETGNRISGNVKACEMSEDTFFEIDEPSDWAIIEKLLQKRIAKSQIPAKKIKMLLTDCDGCLTDGGMYYSENGDELKKFSTQDGLGFRLIREKGIICGIVTGENTKLVKRRAEKLKLEILKMGIHDKLTTVKQLCEEYQISLDEVAYIGDDVNDIELLQAVGFSASVPNAMEEVKEVVDYVTKRPGGSGAVREVIEYLMKTL
ncbi:MAG: HAD-IIIA family hydrolase [Roseburia sp.]